MKKAEKIIETSVVPYEEKALAELKITPEDIAKKVTEYMALRVIPDNPDTYKTARAALTTCVSTRTSVEKRRKELGEDSRNWINAVNQAAKDLLAPLAPAEDHLRKELDLEDGRRREIKVEKERKEKERVDGIRAKIERIRGNILLIQGKNSKDLMTMLDNVSTIQIDEFYQEFEGEARKALDDVKEAINKAIAARITFEIEEATQKEEAEKLAKQKAEQDAIAKAQAEERRKIEEEKARIEAEKRAEQLRKEREEFERIAKERAEVEARAKVEREAAEKKAREEAEAKAKAEREAREAAEKARQEALRPDKEKLIAWANTILEIFPPGLVDKKAQGIASRAIKQIHQIARDVLDEAKKL